MTSRSKSARLLDLYVLVLCLYQHKATTFITIKNLHNTVCGIWYMVWYYFTLLLSQSFSAANGIGHNSQLTGLTYKLMKKIIM